MTEKKSWWKSTGMVAAYIGLAIAFTDAVSTVSLDEHLSWRTAVVAIVSALAAWGRKNATTVIVSWLGVSPPEDPKP